MKHIRILTPDRELGLPKYNILDKPTRQYRGFIDSFHGDYVCESLERHKKEREKETKSLVKKLW